MKQIRDTHCLLMNPIICPGGADTMACSLQHLHICQVALQQTHVVANGQYTLENNGCFEKPSQKTKLPPVGLNLMITSSRV